MADVPKAVERDLDEVERLAKLATDSMTKRDRKIVKLMSAGVSPTLIAQRAAVSRARVYQITERDTARQEHS